MNAVRSMVQDTLRGLIQRRLWPVAVVLLLALVTIPVVMATEVEPAPVVAAPPEDPQAAANEPIVAAASAAQRERVRRVLGNRHNPFDAANPPKPKPTPTPASSESTSGGSNTTSTAASTISPKTTTGTKISTGTTGGSTGSTPPSSTPAPKPAPKPAPTPDNDSDNEPTPEPDEYVYTAKVRFGEKGKEGELLELDGVSAVPSIENPIAVFLGAAAEGAVFLVHEDATVTGDVICEPSSDDCQAVGILVGQSATFTIDQNGETKKYVLEVVKVTGEKVDSDDGSDKEKAGSELLGNVLRNSFGIGSGK